METNANTTPALSVEQQQLELLKKIHRWGMVRTVACLAVAAALAMVAVRLLPQISQLLNELNAITAQLSAVDFVALTDQLNRLAVAGTDGISAATGALTDTMNSLNKINFDALGSSVEGLASVVDSLKAVTDGMNRLFGR